MEANAKELNEKLAGLRLLSVEDGNEIDLVFGDGTGQRFRLQLAYGAGYVWTNLIDLRLDKSNQTTQEAE